LRIPGDRAIEEDWSGLTVPQAVVLLGAGAVLFLAARHFACRWESV
jgi:hypothetical protein